MKRSISGSNAVDDVFSWLDIQVSEPLRILIAEDDAVSRRVLEATLNGYGFKVLSARDGAEACRFLDDNDPPQLAILDWQMPELGGLEVCKWIRSTTKLKHTYVILLTSKDSVNDVITGLQAGANDYIRKPFNRAELRARLQAGVRLLSLQKELAASVCAKCGQPETEENKLDEQSSATAS
jgi:DNA-binding response OmpR family regulator